MVRGKKHAEMLVLILADIVSVSLSVGTASLIRSVALPKIYPTQLLDLRPENISFSLWILAVWIFFLYYEGLYTKRFSFWDEVKGLWRAVFFTTVAVFVIVSIGQLSHIASRSLIIITGLSALFVLPLVRINTQRLLRGFGLFRRRVLIVGAGELGRHCLKALRRERHFGYHVIGFVDDVVPAGRVIDGVKVHKGIDRLERYIRASRISAVFIAVPETDKEMIQGLVDRIQFIVERILLVPDLKSIPMLGTDIHHFFQDQLFSLEIRNNLDKPYNLFLKRVFDLAVSALLLLILSVPMAVLALMIRAGSSGPAFFAQRRVGRRGRPFRIFKFRTMVENSEEELKRLLEHDDGAKRYWEVHRKLPEDPRVTPIGRFLRRTSLDELPQLFNVVWGEMSLVGPRPVTQEELDQHYRHMAGLCFSVPPGITGLWQVSGRSNTDYGYRVALDAWYVRNWSLWLDVVILLKTLKVVVRGDGAY